MTWLPAFLALGLTPLIFDLGCVEPVLAPKLACWMTGAGLAALCLRWRPLNRAGTFCLLWLTWSLAAGWADGVPWQHLGWLQSAIGCFWILGAVPNQQRDERILLAGWTLTLAYSWLQRLNLDPFAWSHPSLSQARTIAGLGNPNYLSMYLACLLPLVAVRNRPMALFGWFSIILTGTRGSQLALLGVAVALMVYRPHWVRRQGWFLLLALLSWGAAHVWLQSSTAPTATVRRAQAESVSVRLLLWQSAIQQGIDHPLWGVGPGNFGFEYLRRRPLEPESLRPLQRCPEDPHSQPLLVFAEQGIPGLLLWLAWMGTTLVTLWRKDRPACACLAVLLVNGLSNAYPLSFWPLLFHWTTQALPEEQNVPKWHLYWLPLSLAVMLAGLAGWLFQRTLWWEDEYRIWARGLRPSREYSQLALLRRANLDRANWLCPPWMRTQQASFEFQFYAELASKLSPLSPELIQAADRWAARRIELQPGNAYAWMSQAQVQEIAGRWPAATTIWAHVRQLDPRNPAVLFWLGQAQYRSGRPTEALVSLQESLEINSKTYQVYQLQAQIMIDLGRTWEGYWSWTQGSNYR